MDSETSAYKIPRTARNVILILAILLVSDVIIAYLGGIYLTDVFFLFRRGGVGIFSDLLFLEGTVAVAIGLINMGGISESSGIKGTRATSDSARREPEAHARLRREQLHSGTLLIIVGPTIIGLSLLLPLLFH